MKSIQIAHAKVFTPEYYRLNGVVQIFVSADIRPARTQRFLIKKYKWVFCNFTSAIASETIPNFSKQYGDYDWSYYTAHPEEDPTGKKDTEKFSLNVGDDVVEPLTDPFSTVAVTKGGYYGHFINAAKYGQTPDEEWKDYWVKLKISYNIPQSQLPENFDPDKLPQNA